MIKNLSILAVATVAAMALPASADGEKLAFLGVKSAPVHPTLAAQLELADDAGLAVEAVVPDGPAAKAGVVKHDILAALDGTALTSPAQLRDLVLTRAPGDEIELTLIRHAKEETVKVTLGTLPEGLGGRDGPAPADPGFPGRPFGIGPGGIIPPGDIDKIFEDMIKKIDPDGVRGFPGFPKGGGIPLPGGGGAAAFASHSSVSIDDGTHKIEMETRDGISTVKAYDSDGKVLYDGPYNTDEEKAAVPEDIRKKLDNMKTDIRILPGRIPFPGRGGDDEEEEAVVPAKKRTI